jgi:hypothetical protein
VIAPSTYPIARLNSAPVMSSTAVYTTDHDRDPQPRPGPCRRRDGNPVRYQRRATQGLPAPLPTHLTWSTMMVTLLPRTSRRTDARSRRAS